VLLGNVMAEPSRKRPRSTPAVAAGAAAAEATLSDLPHELLVLVCRALFALCEGGRSNFAQETGALLAMSDYQFDVDGSTVGRHVWRMVAPVASVSRSFRRAFLESVQALEAEFGHNDLNDVAWAPINATRGDGTRAVARQAAVARLWLRRSAGIARTLRGVRHLQLLSMLVKDPIERPPQWLTDAVYEAILDAAPAPRVRMLRWGGAPLPLRLLFHVASYPLEMLRLGEVATADDDADGLQGQRELSVVARQLGRLAPTLLQLQVSSFFAQSLSLGYSHRFARLLELLPTPLPRLVMLCLFEVRVCASVLDLLSVNFPALTSLEAVDCSTDADVATHWQQCVSFPSALTDALLLGHRGDLGLVGWACRSSALTDLVVPELPATVTPAQVGAALLSRSGTVPAGIEWWCDNTFLPPGLAGVRCLVLRVGTLTARQVTTLSSLPDLDALEIEQRRGRAPPPSVWGALDLRTVERLRLTCLSFSAASAAALIAALAVRSVVLDRLHLLSCAGEEPIVYGAATFRGLRRLYWTNPSGVERQSGPVAQQPAVQFLQRLRRDVLVGEQPTDKRW